MTKIDPEKVSVILATDCGSTTTKAILIQKVDGEYRQTHRGEAPGPDHPARLGRGGV